MYIYIYIIYMCIRVCYHIFIVQNTAQHTRPGRGPRSPPPRLTGLVEGPREAAMNKYIYIYIYTHTGNMSLC